MNDTTTAATDTAATLDQITGPTRQVAKNIVSATLMFCWTLILFLVVYGSPSNSLHISALSWAFTLNGAVIGAYLFGIGYDKLILSRTATTPTK